jgi:signal peptidase I
MSQARDDRASDGWAQRIWREVGPILLAVGIALLLRIFVIDSFRIPSSSMFPTLLIGDHLFVDKLAFGPRIPFTEFRFGGWREPARGDVVVFSAAREGHRVVPADRRRDLPREDFIKRIIALPGDTVEVREDVVTVNGEVLAHEPTGETFRDELGRTLTRHREDLLGCVHDWLEVPGVRGPERSRFTVEPGRYFMMGDNRDNSNDSRVWGTVRFEEMKGPAWRLYFSWDFNGGWLPLLNPATYLHAEWRWDRVGDRVGCP